MIRGRVPLAPSHTQGFAIKLISKEEALDHDPHVQQVLNVALPYLSNTYTHNSTISTSTYQEQKKARNHPIHYLIQQTIDTKKQYINTQTNYKPQATLSIDMTKINQCQY